MADAEQRRGPRARDRHRPRSPGARPGRRGTRVRRSMASASASACWSTSSRRLCQTSSTASRTRRKLGMPWPSRGGKYVPPKKGRPSGVRNTVIGQPPPPRHGLDGLHVDGVHVGTLLPVDLDGDEALVDLLGGLVVLERLVGHDVAPVTGGVADGQEDGTVLGARPGEGLVAPRDTSPPGCARAGGDRGSSPSPSRFMAGSLRPRPRGEAHPRRSRRLRCKAPGEMAGACAGPS